MSELISIGVLAALALWGCGCHWACKARVKENAETKSAQRDVSGERAAIALMFLLPAIATALASVKA